MLTYILFIILITVYTSLRPFTNFNQQLSGTESYCMKHMLIYHDGIINYIALIPINPLGKRRPYYVTFERDFLMT